MKVRNWTAGILAITAVVVVALSGVAHASGAADCLDGQECFDSSMQPLDGAGLNATAGFNFHRHNEGGTQITLSQVQIINWNGVPCHYYVDAFNGRSYFSGFDRPTPSAPQGPWRCGEWHHLNWVLPNSSTGIVYVWVYRDDNSQFTMHSLAVIDFCGREHCTVVG